MFSHRGLAKNEGRSCGRDDLVDHRRVFPARSINFCYHRFNSIKPLAGRVRSTCCISFVWFFLLFSFLFHLLCGQDVQCHLKELRRWNVHLMAARDQDLNQTSRALVGLRRAHSHRACRRACVHAVRACGGWVNWMRECELQLAPSRRPSHQLARSGWSGP